MIAGKDRSVIRELAESWMEFASLPVMQERKRLWKAVHDLKAERPVILFEADWIEGFVADSEIRCEDPFLRSVEKSMRIKLRQAEELGDDLVVEPHYRLGWRMQFSDYGVPVQISFRRVQGRIDRLQLQFSHRDTGGHRQTQAADVRRRSGKDDPFERDSGRRDG